MLSGNADARPSSPRILYYGAGWPTNIGNAFIDLGAMALLHAAVPEAAVAFASEMPRWFFGHADRRETRFGRRGGGRAMDNALDVASITECDLVVFAGMALCEEFIRVNGPTIHRLSGRGVPVLLLGVGADTYSNQEQRVFGEFLDQIRPIGFVSRDDPSYERFAGFAARARRGIDCAFFLPEAYRPFPLATPRFVVAAFDLMPEPALDLQGRSLFRAHHDCWGPVRKAYLAHPNTLISDIPHDYLAVYANADEVHSDRVHACVAALAYGRKARLYHDTRRGALFEAVGAPAIRKELTELDRDTLGKKKAEQVEFVRELLTTCLK
jgi:hypothetical protein